MRKPIFGIASWCVPAFGSLVAYFVVKAAEAHGGLLDGLIPFIFSILILSFCAFAFGLVALLRRERFRWLGLAPFLLGLSLLTYAMVGATLDHLRASHNNSPRHGAGAVPVPKPTHHR